MQKIADFIVKYRYIFLIIFLAASGVSIYFIPKVKVNYDFTKYLSSQSATRIGLNKMQDEFGEISTLQIMIENIDSDKIAEAKAVVESLEGINYVIYSENSNYKNNNVLFTAVLETGENAPENASLIENIRKELNNYEIALNGSTVSNNFMQNAMNRDMKIILIVAVIVIILILTLTSTSWADPMVFAIVLCVAILINLGTNAILGEVSFVTQSICIVMQLALCMDYSIMLLHRFNEEKQTEKKSTVAAKNALAKTFVAVGSSSLTTIAGLVALMFMNYTLGFDIGMVLAKGVVISLLSVFLFMPFVLIALSKFIDKTSHKSLHAIVKEYLTKSRCKRQQKLDNKFETGLLKNRSKIRTLGDFQFSSRIIIPVILSALILSGAVIQTNLQYSYKVEVSKNAGSQLNIDINKISSTFGTQNSLVLLLPKGSLESEIKIIEQASSYKREGKQALSVTAASCLYYEQLLSKDMSQRLTTLGISISPVLTNLAYNIFDIKSASVIEFAGYVANSENPLFSPYKEQAKSALELGMAALSLIENENYIRMLFNLEFEMADENSFATVKYLREIIGEEYREYYLIGESVNYLDIKTAFTADTVKINLISFFAVLLIILISFKSLSIPVLLTLLIQGAIWITMAINVLASSPIFFICYLINMCIQMGATVDYAILMTSRYVEARKLLPKKQAMESAFDKSIITILTSGSILVIAAFIVGIVSSIPMISSLGLNLSLGCLISVLLVIFALPQTLLLSDKIIEKTTLKPDFKKDDKII